MKSTRTPLPIAFLVGVQLPRVSDEEQASSLAELKRLVTTLGYEVSGQLSQKRSSEAGALVLGEGKIRELAKLTGGTGEVGPGVVKKKHKAALRFEQETTEEDVDDFESPPEEDEGETEDLGESIESSGAKPGLVIFDCDLSPSQLRNLERALGVPALDRTGVIIEIFSRHARTRAAKLQVEIARLKYVAPRLRETGGGEDRGGGGGIGGKGAGETSLELDRRQIRDRIKELKDELEAIAHEQDHRRLRRERENTVALVGYTNAGKSSLMRALTGSEVLVADKLFATLDTTVRVLHPESVPRVLISDTVGFIKKLPHDLVASFKSTLDEAAHASLLLFVVDASDASFRSQLEVTKRVLAEVGADDLPHWLVLNKWDRVSEEERARLKAEFPEAIALSTRASSDVAALRERLIAFFETDMIDGRLLVPYQVKGAIGEIRSQLRVIQEDYDERGVTLTVRARPEVLDRLRQKFQLPD